MTCFFWFWLSCHRSFWQLGRQAMLISFAGTIPNEAIEHQSWLKRRRDHSTKDRILHIVCANLQCLNSKKICKIALFSNPNGTISDANVLRPSSGASFFPGLVHLRKPRHCLLSQKRMEKWWHFVSCCGNKLYPLFGVYIFFVTLKLLAFPPKRFRVPVL